MSEGVFGAFLAVLGAVGLFTTLLVGFHMGQNSVRAELQDCVDMLVDAPVCVTHVIGKSRQANDKAFR